MPAPLVYASISNDKEYRQEFGEGKSMVMDVLGIGGKRAVLLLAAVVAVLFAAISMMPGEPDAQTAATNGKIVYSGYDTETNRTHIYTMNPDGTGVTNITAAHTDPNWSPRIFYGDGPEWSPDGTKISASGSSVSDAGNCCSRNVYVMNADGTNVQRLTNTPSTTEGEDYEPTWAPDGSWLAFTSTRSESPRDPEDPINDSDDREIYRMDADGTDETQLTATPSVNTDEQPSISPDGTKIAFASNRHYKFFGDRENADLLDIYIMNADGTGEPRRLTFDAADTYPLETQSQDPAWSPDGTRIAYESTRGFEGKGEIFVMNADGSGKPINVSNDPSWDTDPAWSPDGTQITFTSERAGQRDIWAVDAPPVSSATTPAAALLPLSLGADTALAASEPRNLTLGTGVQAHNPDWGTAPLSGTNACTIQGTASAETIVGTSGADVICAGGGNDTVKGLGGKDILKGQGGNDTLLGGVGDDALDGETGTDTASYSASLSAVIASLATNRSTGEGSDTFAGVENLLGSSKADTLTGSGANNTLTGGGGADTERGGAGSDKVVGSGGADVLYGEGGADAVNSKDAVNGNDSLDGGAGTDTKVSDTTEKSIVGIP
jgi:Tol biopolymer transport system component